MLQQLAPDERLASQSMPEIANRWAGVLRFVPSRIGEARQLMNGREHYGTSAF